MPLNDKDLDQMITDQVSKELSSTIEVPDIDKQWQKIKEQLIETESSSFKQKPILNRKRIVVAATILISIGSINFLYPANVNALGGKVVEFFDYIVGKTTLNKIETYKQKNDSDIPKIQNLGTNVEKEVTLDQARAEVPFKLAIPGYLPPKANIRRVNLTSLGADVYDICIEYNCDDKVFLFSQQNSANGTSRGSLYDTDDTIVKELTVNGSQAMLFMSKNGLNTLNWQLRGLLLQIKGEITEQELLKIANSIN